MDQIRVYEVLKDRLGEEETRLLLEYVEGIRREVLTREIFEKTMEVMKAEILAKVEELRVKTERDKAEILAKVEELRVKTERDKAEILAKMEELRVKTERDRAEILAKVERDKAEIVSSTVKWVVGIILAQTTLIVSLILYLAK